MGEPVISESVKAGADIISFSGDKLLGASQAGLIVGRLELVERLRKHPLYRALRADKLSLAALEATLEAHRRGASTTEIPALRMLALTKDEIQRRARAFLSKLKKQSPTLSLSTEIIEGESAIGGGSAPTTHPPTALIALTHETLSADALDEALRRSQPPVVARINEGRVVLDLRTVAFDEEQDLLAALSALPA
jgi:L-seryl-tRNA(Ser) seleniumtransferase